MLQLLRRFLGSSAQRQRALPLEDDDGVAASSDRLSADGPSDLPASLAQHAILDRGEQIVGYELALRENLSARLRRRGGMARRTYDAALLSRLSAMPKASLLGRRLAFVNLGSDALSLPALEGLPGENSVVLIDPDGSELLSSRRDALRTRGFALGMNLQPGSGLEGSMFDGLDFVAVDATEFDGLDLQDIVRTVKRMPTNGLMAPRLIARNLTSDDDFRFCFRAGYDLFQGSFLSHVEQLPSTHGGINRMMVLSILSMVRSDQNFGAIARQIKNDPMLTYKLLRYLNSAAVGLRTPIDSVIQGLVLLGRDQFYRWLSLLLFDFAKPGYRERALMERALVRGRMMELLAGKGTIPSNGDHLFLIGLFSLLDVAIGRPLAEIVQEAALPQPVRDTLLGKPGPLQATLALARVGEAGADTPQEEMTMALGQCGIALGLFEFAASDALVWADQVSYSPAGQVAV